MLSYIKRKQNQEKIKENLFIFNLLFFKMFMKILKILNITSLQHVYLSAVSLNENSEDFLDFT